MEWCCPECAGTEREFGSCVQCETLIDDHYNGGI